jgi:hypothetical protein
MTGSVTQLTEINVGTVLSAELSKRAQNDEDYEDSSMLGVTDESGDRGLGGNCALFTAG